jgi:hypothetical protein
MHSGKILLSQLMDFVPRYEFLKCVGRYRGNYKIKSFSCWDQYLCMAFAQLTYRESLRDIEACLRAAHVKLYHMGIRGKVSRNTLAHANEVRDYRIYEDFTRTLISTARGLYVNEPFGVELEQTVYALDSTTIDLCLSLFPWAEFRRRKGAIKMHTLLDLRGNIPSMVIVTPGKVHDVNILDNLMVEAGAIYILDKAYIDYARLYGIHKSLAFFVTRAKKNFNYRRLYSHPKNVKAGIRSDQTVMLKGYYAGLDYPEKLRRISYIDQILDKRFIFLTNNFDLPAITIAELYRCRWQVELFFKWIKSHLRIKKFFGLSDNAVKTQIWIAISIYVLVAIVKKRLNLRASLYQILQILSVTLFEKIPIEQALSDIDTEEIITEIPNQLKLFN